MIVPTYTEKEILSELINDYKLVKRQSKKKADKYLKSIKKSGRFIKESDYESYELTFQSNNVWFVTLEYNQTYKIPWLIRGACCIVEGNYKSKDFYIIRGINTDNPYFIKVTSHALIRFKERNNLKKNNTMQLKIVAPFIFEHRETAICMKYIDLEYEKFLQNVDDIDEIGDLSYIVLTNKGVFFAKKTPMGNYIFKTYISSFMGMMEVLNAKQGKNSKWERQGELLTGMLVFHQYYNRRFYDKDFLEEYLYKVLEEGYDLESADKNSIILLRS